MHGYKNYQSIRLLVKINARGFEKACFPTKILIPETEILLQVEYCDGEQVSRRGNIRWQWGWWGGITGPHTEG